MDGFNEEHLTLSMAAPSPKPSLSPVNVFRSDARHAQSARFSPDGQRLYTAGQDRAIKAWDPTDWAKLAELRGHRATSWLAGWGTDGSLVSAGSDDTVRAWDVSAGQERFSLDRAIGAAPSPVDETLLVRHATDRLAVHEPATGEEVISLGKPPGRVVSMAWHPRGDRILLGGVGELTVLDAETGDVEAHWPGHEAWVTTLLAHPSGAPIASLGSDGRFVRWDQDGNVLDASHVPEGVSQLAWHPQGDKLAFAGKGHLFVLREPDACTLAELRLDIKGLYGLDWSPSGRLLANAAADGRIRVWRWEAPEA